MGRSSQRKKERKEQKTELTVGQARELLQAVRDDLNFLMLQSYKKPSGTDVRISSSILRRLLYDQMYSTAWTLSGLLDQPKIEALDLGDAISNIEPRYIQYAYAGGANTQGANYKGHVLLSIPAAEAETEGYEVTVRRISQLIKPIERRLFSLFEFCQSPSVVSGQATVSRLDVIRYVANKLGGVHWDNARKEWSDPLGSRHRFLDEKHIMVGRLSAPLYEVISIAQDIGSASDTKLFIDRVNEVAPDIENENTENNLSFREGRIGKYAHTVFNNSSDGK